MHVSGVTMHWHTGRTWTKTSPHRAVLYPSGLVSNLENQIGWISILSTLHLRLTNHCAKHFYREYWEVRFGIIVLESMPSGNMSLAHPRTYTQAHTVFASINQLSLDNHPAGNHAKLGMPSKCHVFWSIRPNKQLEKKRWYILRLLADITCTWLITYLLTPYHPQNS